MKTIILHPSAKINIGLYVFEKRADGFHEIESVFFPVGPENSNLTPDKLTVSIAETEDEKKLFLSDGGEGKVTMVETGLEYPGKPEDNICVKAYNLLDADYSLPPAVISLEKHLPTGAGLGGGSSDGVCTLKALSNLCGLDLTEDQLLDYAAKLGSDCPFFVRNAPMLVTGRGEILTPLEEPAATALENLMENYRVEIVFSPDCFVSTKKAYAIVPKRKRNNSGSSCQSSSKTASTSEEHCPYISLTELITEPVENWQGRIINDFEAPVFKEFPQLQNIKNSLKEIGAAYVSMTGSGSAIYALFKK